MGASGIARGLWRRVEADGVAAPLPDLGAADLQRREVLHEAVPGHAADAGAPAAEVGDADADVRAEAVHRARAGALRHEVGARRRVEAGAELVRGVAEGVEERLGRWRDEVRVRDPAAVVADGRLEGLVGDHLRGLALALRGVAAGREGGHAAHAQGAMTMADVDEVEGVGHHPGPFHGDASPGRG